MQFTLSELLIAAFIAWLLLAMLAGSGNHHESSVNGHQQPHGPGITYQLPTAHGAPAVTPSAHQGDVRSKISQEKAEIEAMLDEVDTLLR